MPPKKVLAFDFDDVVMNFNGCFVLFHNRMYGTTLTYEGLYLYDNWERMYGADAAEMINRAKAFYNSLDHDNAISIEGAFEGLAKLANSYSLQIVTSRPDTVKEHTMKWIERFVPGIFSAVHFTNSFGGEINSRTRNKSAICHEIGAAVFVDDAIKHVRDVAESGIPTLLPDRPWNREPLPTGVTRVHSWSDIVDWVKKNV